MRKTFALATALLLVCCFTAIADDKPAAKKMEMDPAMMKAMMDAATPGAAHKALDGMIGTWDTKVTSWMMPGMDPMVSTGTSENKWIMGGRYVEQRFKGDIMGMAFEGIGITGYDNVKKQYFGTWIDSMSTGMMTSVGTGGDAKTMTFKGTFADPMSGKDVTCEEKMTVIDADHTTFEMWVPGPDGKMFKTMAIEYSRKK